MDKTISLKHKFYYLPSLQIYSHLKLPHEMSLHVSTIAAVHRPLMFTKSYVKELIVYFNFIKI
jgi:hypothetical protein